MKLVLIRLLAVILLFGTVTISHTHATLSLPPMGFCGDGFVDLGEVCDGFTHTTCSDFGFDSGLVTCNGCVEDTSGCFNEPISVCGDGNISEDESCDDGQANGIACSPEYGESCEYCSSTCQTQSLLGGSCGDGIVQEEYEQCEGELYVRKSLYSQDMCSSIPYGETCSSCNTNTCQNQVIEGPNCGDGNIDAVVCAGWFDSESTTGPDFGTNLGNTPRHIPNNDECDPDSVDGLELCAVYDGSSFYSCRGTCSQGECQTAPKETSPQPKRLSNVQEYTDLNTVCFYHKTGLLENGVNQLPGYTYHGNGMGSIGESEEIIDLDQACASFILPSEECDDGSKNGQLCSGEGCSYCTASCSQQTRSGGGSPSSISSAKFITTLETDTKEEEETQEEVGSEEDRITNEDDTQPASEEETEKPENEGKNSDEETQVTDTTECYEDDYIVDRFSKLSQIPIEEIVTVPEAFQPYFSESFTTVLESLIARIGGMEAEEGNALIEKVVCKIETAKAKNGTKHENTGYESGGSLQEYILQYIQDRIILLYTV